jgi:hypothetical protein
MEIADVAARALVLDVRATARADRDRVDEVNAQLHEALGLGDASTVAGLPERVAELLERRSRHGGLTQGTQKAFFGPSLLRAARATGSAIEPSGAVK